jgi:hypothetical protein
MAVDQAAQNRISALKFEREQTGIIVTPVR